MRFVLATASSHKAREIAEILHGAGLEVELVPRPAGLPEVEETGATLEDNARLKAVAVCEATGLPSLADDTGLEVDALGGAPGVHSARFAAGSVPERRAGSVPERRAGSAPEGTGSHDTERNIAKLLSLLDRVPDAERSARFVTVAIARFPDGREVAAIGSTEGTIIREARHGASGGGFGYDPVFVPAEGRGETFAEMSARAKHEISHRGRAFRTLADGLGIVAAVEQEE